MSRSMNTTETRRCAGWLMVVALAGGLSTWPVFGAGPADFLVDQFSVARFKRNIEELSAFGSRHWTQPGNALAVEYIRAKLESFGYTNVVLDPYTFEGETRHNIYATKMGTVEPTQMYIISAHMDSFSNVDVADAPGADDDGSGTSLVLEIARVFAKARTDLSVRFLLFNNEETGLDGSGAYVTNHRALQGTLAEPTWLGDIQHDMILYDRFPVPDADVEYQATHDFGGQSITFANFVAGAMARYGSMPAEVTDDMNNTDSKSFWDDVPAISVRENRRLAEIGRGSNPHYHQPTDVPETYAYTDYLFGLNIVKMTAGAVAELVGAVPDCNENNIADADDITAVTSLDTNGDGVPDECQDCNGNGTVDPLEITAGTATDCNGNATLDECDLASGHSVDINTNLVPDECDVDCQPNGIPDELDVIVGGISPDCDASGVPDECEGLAATTPLAEEPVVTKNRQLTFVGGNPGLQTTLRLTIVSAPPPHDVFNGQSFWVGPPQEICENSGQGPGVAPQDCVPTPTLPSNTFLAATLQCDPHVADWSTFDKIHVYHEILVPGAEYELRAINAVCDASLAQNYSTPLPLFTGKWGDIVGIFENGLWLPPDGVINVPFDLVAELDKFRNLPGAPTKARPDVNPAISDWVITISDIVRVQDAFQGADYPFLPGPPPCPDPA